MSFLHPGWLLLSLIIPLVVLGAILTHRSQGKSWKQLVAPRLRAQLVQESPRTRRWVSLAFGLLGCLLIIFVIARPYQGKITTTEEIRTRNLLIAIDTSRSMLVKDGSPDRMTTAKTMALEITNAFPNDRIGIIAFSGTSVLLAPMTIDHTSIRDTIGQLDTDVIPSGGSNLASATKTAMNAFGKISHNSNALIIISDGEDHSQAIDNIAKQISNGKFAVSAVAVGTKDGGMIPDTRYADGKYRDTRGNPVHSKMIPDALLTLSKAGGGTFTQASSTAPTTIRDSLAFLQSNQQEGRQVALPNEQYPWFMIPAILCLVASMIIRSQLFSARRTAPVAACILLLVVTTHDSAAASDLENATRAYDKQDYPAAMEAFQKALEQSDDKHQHAIQFSLGSTAYRLKKWHKASEYFSQSLLSPDPHLREASHYNMGNTLFQSAWSLFKPADQPDQAQPDSSNTYQIEDADSAITQLEDAIKHYSASLKLNQQHEDALHNRSEAEKLLKKIKDQHNKEQEDQNKKDSDKGKGDKPKNKGDKPDQSPNQQGNGDQQTNKPDNGNQDDPSKQPDNGENTDPNNQEQPDNNSAQQEQQPGESDEAYAARILKDNADAETRPVKSRFLRIRRPAKDW